MDPDRFGYASDHYIVSCNPAREHLAEWSAFSGVRTEIQVGTVLQHAWVAIDHKLAYKRASDVPAEFRRQLSRLSALLEVGDEQFEAVRSASARLDATYDSKTREGDLALPIDAASLQAYLRESERVQAVVKLASALGFRVPTEDLRQGIGHLVRATEAAHLPDLAALDAFLKASADNTEGVLDTFWQHRPTSAPWTAPVAFLIASLVWSGIDVELAAVKELTASDDFYIEGLTAAREIVRREARGA